MSDQNLTRLERDLGMSAGEAAKSFLLAFFTAGFGNIIVGGLNRSRGQKDVQVSLKKVGNTRIGQIVMPDGTQINMTEAQMSMVADVDLAKQNGVARRILLDLQDLFKGD